MCSTLWKEINVILKTRENSCNCTVHVMRFLWQSVCQGMQNPVEKGIFLKWMVLWCCTAFAQSTNSSPAPILQEQGAAVLHVPCLCCIYDSMIHFFLWFMALEAVITSYPSLPHKICSPEQLLDCCFRIYIIHVLHLGLHLLLQWCEGSPLCASRAFCSH